MRINDFARAVGAKLPALVGPKDRNHRQAKTGEQSGSVLRGAHLRDHFFGVMPQREKHGAQNHDDAGFDQRCPVLQDGALSRAPNIDGRHNRNHDDGNESLCYR